MLAGNTLIAMILGKDMHESDTVLKPISPMQRSPGVLSGEWFNE